MVVAIGVGVGGAVAMVVVVVVVGEADGVVVVEDVAVVGDVVVAVPNPGGG